MAIELKIASMTINGHPHTCPECSTAAFTLDGRGLFDAFPAWGACSNYHSWEHPLLTVGDLKQIQAARTGRERAEDEDTFAVEIGGAVLAGTLQPELTADDIRQAVKRVYWQKLLKPALRRRKRAAIRAVKRPAKNAVAAAKAAALTAAWDLQAGGHQLDPDHTPEPINPCPACDGKGRFKLDSHLHDTTTVRCTVCSGTGEID
ncbi:hypothetical protein [Streptomyces sp. NPDC058291]|uniref:hypothetical protein n=1 Tax=Streptomyces sp. NPDC058291 TaxID=3346427 RepID=UPI0036EB6C3D